MYVICLSWEIGGGAVESVAASSTGYTGYCLANSVAVALWGEGLGYMGLDMSNCLIQALCLIVLNFALDILTVSFQSSNCYWKSRE